jgi:TRAP-type C4-dicarboxylate transport system permease small subunit
MTFRRTVMQDMITSLTTILTWLVLLLCVAVVVLLGLSAWHLQWHRRRPLLGVMAMALVVGATGVSLMLLSQKAHSWTGRLLPLAAPLLMVSRCQQRMFPRCKSHCCPLRLRC